MTTNFDKPNSKRPLAYLMALAMMVFSINVFAQTNSLISDCSDFDAGPNAWPYVLEATTIADGAASQASQSFTINVTLLPLVNGASYRVYKTTANGNDFFGPSIALTYGINTITVPAVTFDRAVKFQFSNGTVRFNSLSLNGVNSSCVATPPPPTTSLISDCGDFDAGPSAWPYVLEATTIADGAASQASQTYNMNVTALPAGGANVRVYKTTANGNDFWATPVALTLGANTITVAAVGFDRAVKFQFSSGDVEFDALNLNGVDSECIATATAIEMSKHYLFLNAFPNPSNGNLFIKSNDPIELLEIKDLSGRVILKESPQKTKVHIQTSQLKNSFYFLSCFIKQQWVTRKIIVN